jgi:hypothetical protein
VVTLGEPRADNIPELAEVFGSMIVMDDPQHLHASHAQV